MKSVVQCYGTPLWEGSNRGTRASRPWARVGPCVVRPWSWPSCSRRLGLVPIERSPSAGDRSRGTGRRRDGCHDDRPARRLAHTVRPRLLPRPQRPAVHGVARRRVPRRSQPALRVHARLAVVLRHAHPAAALWAALREAAGLDRAGQPAGRGADPRRAARHDAAGHRRRPSPARGAGVVVGAAACRRSAGAGRHARRLFRHLQGRDADAVAAARRRRLVQPRRTCRRCPR